MSSSGRSRRSTATSNFGVGKREAHDASAFYGRFPVPEISSDDHVAHHACVDKLWVGDARDMDACGDVADNSVALVVTSPPYFAGKEYEEAVGEGHVPEDYVAYLQMLEDVFAECVRKLEPGGRIAVNVANLGRRPYRSLSADVLRMLQDRLRLLLRGEVIWRKARGATGSCAWGSFQRPSNPVLRDLTERVLIASKGRLDRARSAGQRFEEGLPSIATAHVDEFMEATTDVWEIEPASATRIGHPAPFPVALPKRLIELYTYKGDLVMDPFIGSGSTAVAAVQTERHYVGFDTDGDYLQLAEERVTQERESRARGSLDRHDWQVEISPANGRTPVEDTDTEDFQARAGREGLKAQEMAFALLHKAGFVDFKRNVAGPCGVEVNFKAKDKQGHWWYFDVSGAFSVTQRPGLKRTDTVWKALGKAAVLHSANPDTPLVLLTTDRPPRNSTGGKALKELTGPGKPVCVVLEMHSPKDLDYLASLATGEVPKRAT